MANPITGAIAKAARSKPKTNPLTTGRTAQYATKKAPGNPGTVVPEIITPFEGRKRTAFPGIYGNPDEIIQDVQVAPESPLLQRLWGVNRQDLADIALDPQRRGNLGDWRPPGAPAKPRGSAAARQVMTDENAERIYNLFSASQRRPDLNTGMAGWYVQDPMWERMQQLMDPQEAERRFRQSQGLSSLASPGSPVSTEINRGSRADYLAEQGRFDEFMDYGGAPSKLRMEQGWNQPRRQFEYDPGTMLGHPYHSTSQGPPMQRFLESGLTDLGGGPKVPGYDMAGMVPDLGFQTNYPTPDAHFARGIGLADVRGNKDYAKSASMPEALDVGPWFNDIAENFGVSSSVGQPVVWGGLSRQTGVDTPVGQGRLELISDAIGKTARETGMAPEQVRDMWLKGKHPIGAADPEMLAYIAAAMGGATAGGALAKGHFQNEANPITGR